MVVCGSFDDKLTEAGIAQAKAAGSELSNVNFDFIFSSDLSRAYDTAKEIADQGKGTKEVIRDPLLREKDFGRFEQRPNMEYAKLAFAAGWKKRSEILAYVCFLLNQIVHIWPSFDFKITTCLPVTINLLRSKTPFSIGKQAILITYAIFLSINVIVCS